MGSNLIKSELALLGKKQVDLLYEVQKRGYKRLGQSQLSAYLRGTLNGPQAEAVKKLACIIIDEWKNEGQGRMAQ